jgi:hypothetical protein
MVPTFVSGAGNWTRVIVVVIEKIIIREDFFTALCSTSMLQTDGGLVRKGEKPENGEFWNLPDGSIGKCRLDGSWFIVRGQRTLVN